MTDRIDGYLSNYTQHGCGWPTSLVVCRTDAEGAETWLVTNRGGGLPDLGLGDSFGRAQMSVKAIISSRRASQ